MTRVWTVAAVVHDGTGRVLLLKHKKYGCWLCPGGHIEPGELPEDAVLREVAEETGLAVRILPNGEETSLGDGRARVLATPFCVLEERASPDLAHIDLVYRCTVDGDQALRVNPAEASEARWFTPAHIIALKSSDIFENVRRVALRSAALLR